MPAGSYASDDSSSRSFAGFNDDAAEFDLSLSLAESTVLTGAAGRPVDCAGTLPCRWLAEDAGFAVTLTAADDVGTADRLVIEWSVTATHDTELVVGAAGDALVQGGAGPEAARVTLGTGHGLVPTELRAGDSITGHIDFDAAVGETSIAEWRLSLLDNGLPREAVFRGVPVGSQGVGPVDCNGRLPCTWTDTTSGATITLLTVGGFSSARRLSAGFVIESETSLDVAIDKGSEARSVEGFPFASRNHRLGTQNGDAELVETLLPGMALAGGIDFFRADTATATLSELVIELYQAAPVPRWRPHFLDIPAVTP